MLNIISIEIHMICTCLEDSTPTTSTIDQPLVEVKRDIGISTATLLQRFVAQAQAETQRTFPKGQLM